MKDELLIILMGKSASGKDTIANYLSEYYRYNRVTPYTTRPMRPNESQGNPYYFIDNETFNSNKDKMVTSGFIGWQYGFMWKDIDNTKFPLLVADNMQIRDIVDNCTQIPVIIYLERDDTQRYISQLNRGCKLNEVYRRSIHDEASFQMLLQSPLVYPIDNNGKIEDTVKEILSLIAIKAGK